MDIIQCIDCGSTGWTVHEIKKGLCPICQEESIEEEDIQICYTCKTTTGTEPKGDNYCNMCDHYF